jgi:hypothetical protein
MKTNMQLWHSTEDKFEGFKTDLSNIKGWDGQEHENLGLWCSEERDYCIGIYRAMYKDTKAMALLDLQTKFGKEKILDARVDKDIIMDMVVNTGNPNIPRLPLKDYINALFAVSSELGSPAYYWDEELDLPNYALADKLVMPAKMFGYKAIMFSEELPQLEGRVNDPEYIFVKTPSILVFDPINELVIKTKYKIRFI